MAADREESLEERRSRLSAELAGKRNNAPGGDDGEERAAISRKGYGDAMKLSSEFISAVVVGAVLGYVLDRFASTAPWGMIVFLLLGFCAGVLNVLRAAGKVAQPHTGAGRADRHNDGGN